MRWRPSAHLHETVDAWVLSSFTPRAARSAATYVADTRKRIARLLDGLAEFPADARSILVVLDNLDDYYKYVSNYHPDSGEFAFSGGMYINYGCPHFVTVQAPLSTIEPVIAHEMTHSALAHLELPLWLDEGIAVTTEHQISVSNRHPRDAAERIGRHLEFWNAERIQEFWTGKSFNRTDDGNELSYDLARSIVELLGREWPSFVEFAANASRDDGGAAAASRIYETRSRRYRGCGAQRAPGNRAGGRNRLRTGPSLKGKTSIEQISEVLTSRRQHVRDDRPSVRMAHHGAHFDQRHDPFRRHRRQRR